jgi:endoglucanase
MKKALLLLLSSTFVVACLWMNVDYTQAAAKLVPKDRARIDDSGNKSGDSPLMTPGGFYVKGRYIYNKKGKKVIFRGVNRPGYGDKPDGDWRQHPNEYPEIAKWGANHVRIPINQHYWLTDIKGSDGKGYRSKIAGRIKLVNDNGMAAIADLHRSVTADGKWPTDLPMADEESLEFWKKFAKEYKDNGKVMFELYNEPKNVPAKIWMHGGKVGEKTHVGMQQMYDAIRKLGAHNLILVSGLNWGYDLRGLKKYPMDKNVYNVVYVTHTYNYGGKREANWAKCWAWIIPKHPVIITEFGYTKDCKKPDGTYSLDYTKAVYKFAEDNELGWSAWAWTSIFVKHSIFVRNIPHTYDPSKNIFGPLTAHGRLVKDMLLKYKKKNAFKTPHPRATNEQSRGIKFSIN